MNSLEYFFSIYNANNIQYTSGENSKSVDGSGHLPSVNNLNAPNIVEYITKLGFKTVIDIGAGLGYLQWAADKVGANFYSFEGSSKLLNDVVCDKSKYCVYDVTYGVDSLLHNCCDLTTSFEVIEHIHRDDQKAYWDSIEKLARWHLCSIHVTGQEDKLHKTIQSPIKWLKFFNDRGYRYQILHWHPVNRELGDIPRDWNLIGWESSIIMLLEVGYG